MMVQSERMATYQQALDSLRSRELIYPCYLSRRQLDSLLSAPHPRNTDRLAQGQAPAFQPATGDQPAWLCAWKLSSRCCGVWTLLISIAAASPSILLPLVMRLSPARIFATSYHLSVVVDDAASAVTLITRGADLLPVTPLHRILQELLGLPETTWCHHAVMTDSTGRRLSKRAGDITLQQLRAEGHNRKSIIDMIRKSNFSPF